MAWTQKDTKDWGGKKLMGRCKEDGCAGNTNCSCNKFGIQCSMSCTKCNGVSCMNPTVPDTAEEQNNIAEL